MGVATQKMPRPTAEDANGDGIRDVAVSEDEVLPQMEHEARGIVSTVEGAIQMVSRISVPFAVQISKGYGDVPQHPLFRRCISEFAATMFFVMVGCGTAMVNEVSSESNLVRSGDSATNPAEFEICMAFGFAIVAIVYGAWSVSGGHLNPAVTTALMVSGHTPVIDGVLYIVSQFCGSLVGAALLAAMIPREMDKSGGNTHAFATNSVAKGFSQGNAFCGEFVMSFLLLFVIYNTAVVKNHHFDVTEQHSALALRRSGMARKQVWGPERVSAYVNKVRQWAPLAIGLAVFVAHCVLVPITGCSINPTRTLGPLIVGDIRGLPNDDPWTDLWVFVVAPECAALVVGLLYCFYEKQDQDCPHRKGSAQPHLIAELPKSPEVTTQVNPLPLPTMQAAAPAEHSEPRQFNNSSGKMRRSSDKPSQAQPMVDDTAVII